MHGNIGLHEGALVSPQDFSDEWTTTGPKGFPRPCVPRNP